MGTFTKLILTTIVDVVATLVSAYLPLLSCVCGKRARRETSLLGFHNSGVSRIPGARGG
jgi:hypothetical protein